MRRIKEALRLHLQAGLSYDEIGRALKISKSSAGKYVSLARAAEVNWELAQTLTDVELEARLFRPPVPRSSHQLAPDFALVHQELKRAGVTLQLLWEEYARDNASGLQVHELLHQVPRVRAEPEALDAPGPPRRREAVRRLLRRHRARHRRGHRRDHPGADLRGHARSVELHLRLRHRAADHRRLDRRPGACPRVLRWHATLDRARPDPLVDQVPRQLRPRAQPGL